MGGDQGIEPVVAALAVYSQRKPSILFTLLVTPETSAKISAQISEMNNVSVHEVEQVIAVDLKPSDALRLREATTMSVALKMLAAHQVDAVVSSGNTGALMALARRELSMLPGLLRPPIIAAFPSKQKPTWMLDLGANVQCQAKHYAQFAMMGSWYVEHVEQRQTPRVGLLNIGVEAQKGSAVLHEADQLLKALPLNYVGYVEGDAIFSGDVDVLVCDGFTGNTVLKSCEGLAQMLRYHLRRSFGQNWLRRVLARIFLPKLRKIHSTFNPDHYNGATLLGLDGVVVKSHGASNASAWRYAIERAVTQVKFGVPKHLRKHLEQLPTD